VRCGRVRLPSARLWLLRCGYSLLSPRAALFCFTRSWGIFIELILCASPGCMRASLAKYWAPPRCERCQCDLHDPAQAATSYEVRAS
jgi:hypothetical protein